MVGVCGRFQSLFARSHLRHRAPSPARALHTFDVFTEALDTVSGTFHPAGSEVRTVVLLCTADVLRMY